MNLGDRLRLAAARELEAENLRLRAEIDRLRASVAEPAADDVLDLTDRQTVLATT